MIQDLHEILIHTYRLVPNSARVHVVGSTDGFDLFRLLCQADLPAAHYQTQKPESFCISRTTCSTHVCRR